MKRHFQFRASSLACALLITALILAATGYTGITEFIVKALSYLIAVTVIPTVDSA